MKRRPRKLQPPAKAGGHPPTGGARRGDGGDHRDITATSPREKLRPSNPGYTKLLQTVPSYSTVAHFAPPGAGQGNAEIQTILMKSDVLQNIPKYHQSNKNMYSKQLQIISMYSKRY